MISHNHPRFDDPDFGNCDYSYPERDVDGEVDRLAQLKVDEEMEAARVSEIRVPEERPK